MTGFSVLLATLALSAALAQPGGQQQESDASSKETRLLIRHYGDCVVSRQQDRAAEAILANMSNRDLMRRYPQLIEGRCMPVERGQVVKVSFVGDQFRYALADALVRKELAALPAPDLSAVPRLDHREPTPPSRFSAKGKPLRERDYQEAMSRFERDRAFTFLSRYGECVVRTDPAAARTLLLAEVGSTAEAAQFASMTNTLGTCLPPGETLSFGKLALRGTIATNYYRLAKAAQSRGAGQ